MSSSGMSNDPERPTPASPSSSSATEVEVGESLPERREGRLRIKTTRSEESLFTTVYADVATGTVRLALQVNIRTGQTAIDPRRLDREFWTLVAQGERHPAAALERVLRRFRSPGIEVRPEAEEIHIYADGEGPHDE